MDSEDRGGREWLLCPNGCATECEAPERKVEIVAEEPESHVAARAAASQA
jgi:hypothetical protein